MESYQRICAFVCIYIERVVGQPTVDHMLPKSLAWDQVYEWSNYRLVSSLMNSRKGDAADVIDPFEVEEGWFELDLVSFRVVAGADADEIIRERVQATIDRLRLNDYDCRTLRTEYAESYLVGEIRLGYLERRAPFVASELRRQGRLLSGDAANAKGRHT